ncbi:MAG: inositol monophosphatase [Candidatus Paceibacterota bacterium]
MHNKDLKILIKAAHAGGEILKKYFGQTLDTVQKSTIGDFQTKADLGSEKAIIATIRKYLPLYNIQSEEDGRTENGSDYTIIIDPLDGTNNFVLGMPHFSVSIGLLYKNEPVAGVVYLPIVDQLYTAEKGKGAYLNKKIINVNNITDVKKLNIVYTCGYTTSRPYIGQLLKNLIIGDHKRILHNWSAAFEYCMLASGKIETVITDGVEVHDFAAGKLIAMEAGAKIIDFSGKREREYVNTKFISSNTDKVNKHILGIIKPLQTLTK